MADPEKKEPERPATTSTPSAEAKGVPQKSSKTLIIIIVAVILLAGLGGGGYFFFLKKSSKKEAEKEPQKTDHKQAQPTEVNVLGPSYPLATFIVNIISPTGSRFLKVNMEFELDNAELSKELDARKPQIRDIIIGVLSSKTVGEISNLEGKKNLQREIMYKLNSLLVSGKIKEIFFTEFVMQ